MGSAMSAKPKNEAREVAAAFLGVLRKRKPTTG